MVKIDGYDIQLSRGDSLCLRIDLAGRDLPEGTDAVFSVKKNVKCDDVLIQKRVNASCETAGIVLSPRETNLPPGIYCWDLRLLIPGETGGYGVETPMDYAAFVVTEVVGDHLEGGMDFDEVPDLPVIQVLLAEMRLAIQNADEMVAGVQEAAQSRAPYIGSNHHWWLWNHQTNAYEDSGVSALANAEALRHVDAEKLGGKPPEAFTAVNLLDNSDFTNPVNQRGLMRYGGAEHTIDRWQKESDAVLTIADSCITIDNSANTTDEVVIQKVDSATAAKLVGKTITIAVCLSDGTVYANSGTVVYDTPVALINMDAWALALHFFHAGQSYQAARLIVAGGRSVSVKWIALYEGQYTAETLPPYVPKGYAVELAECQRYFQIIKSGYPVLGNAYSSGTDSAQMALQLERSMRYPPTVTIDDTKIGLTFNGVYLYATGATWQTDMSVFNPCMKATLTFANGSFPAVGYPCVPYLDADIYVSADP